MYGAGYVTRAVNKEKNKIRSKEVPDTPMENNPIIIPIFTMCDEILTCPWSNITMEFYI